MFEPTGASLGAPSVATLAAAAEVVGGSGVRALLLSVRNEGLGWVPLGDAASLGLAYAVTPRPDLLCIDLDLDGADRRTRQATFEEVLAAAERCGLPHLVCDSGRPGHRHLFVATGELPAGARDRLDAVLRAGGLDVRRGAVRPPFAPHRDGITRSTPHGDPASLRVAPDPAAVDEFCSTFDAAPRQWSVRPDLATTSGWSEEQLGVRMRRVLVDGFARHGYRSPSEARMAVAVAAVSTGAGAEDLHRLFSDRAHRLGVTFRRRRRDWQLAECERLVAKAAAWLGSPHRSVERWAAAVTGARWVGQAGLTDLAVAELFAAVAVRRSSSRVALARDEVAVEAGVAISTARRSLRRLVAAGWLRVVAAPSATSATVYELCTPPGSAPSDTAAAPVSQVVDLGCDAAARGALGRAAVRLWRLLYRPVSTAELATRVGVGCSTVRGHLRRLAAAGCVTVDDGRWVRCGDLAAVAARCGVAGTRQRRRAALVALRAERRRWLAQPSGPSGPPSTT